VGVTQRGEIPDHSVVGGAPAKVLRRFEPGVGWVRILGVIREHRQRGLGQALLRHTFREFAGRGFNAVALGVDAENPTGAVRVYERAGMHVERTHLIYATGVSPLQRLRHATREQWMAVIETNLVGLHEVVQAALPHLSDGAAVGVLSSDSVGTPRPGLVPYAASKAALEELIEQLDRRIAKLAPKLEASA